MGLLWLFLLGTGWTDSRGEIFEGISFGHHDIFEGVQVYSTKVEGVRVFYLARTYVFQVDIEDAYNYLLRFDLRCNNKHREKRKFIPKDFDCPYHTGSIVEGIIERNLKETAPVGEETQERFVLKRRIYNRGHFSYNDLVTAKKGKRGGKKSYRIDYRMLEAGEAQQYIDHPLEFDSAFHGTRGSYTLTEFGEGRVEVAYTYFTKTDHWVLRHDWVRTRVARGIFWGIKNSINQLALFARNQKAQP